MPYIVNRFNGSQLLAVEDGTVDVSTDIKLIGKNYSGYGEAQNENFLHLMEHFAGTTPPTKAISGQVWYDSGTNKLKFYTGTTWKNAGGAEVSTVAPVGTNEGDLWWNTNNNQLYARTADGDFLLIGPQAAGSGTTQLLSVNVLDTLNAEKTVIIALINDLPVYIISNEEFTLNSTQPASIPNLSGFTLIKKGTTLINTDSTTGVTANAGDTGEPVYWGTASNALRLNGVDADSFLKINAGREILLNENSDGGATVVAARFNDNGFTVGNSNDLQVKIINGSEAYLGNFQGNKISFAAAATPGNPATILSIRNDGSGTVGLVPEADNLYTLGTSSLQWANVYARTFNGNATSADTLKVNGTARIARDAGTVVQLANTVAARDASANIVANLFVGTATQAQYADLAEKYTTETDYPVGTAMTVSNDSHKKETIAAESSDIAIGVISDKPAYLMNSELKNGQAIALKGRVPVRVKGTVLKGQAVYAWKEGVCSTIPTRAMIGVALETNSSEDEKLVECVLKV